MHIKKDMVVLNLVSIRCEIDKITMNYHNFNKDYILELL